MIVEMNGLSSGRVYHLMTQALIPRPVAWVLTRDPEERLNLAPFSYFNAVTSEPPLVMLSIGKKAAGEPKDTRQNIIDTGKLVIHLGRADDAQSMTETSRPLPRGESELDRAGLSVVPFEGFELPRLADAPVAMACDLYQIQEIGPKAQALILAEVRQMYLRDDTVTLDGDRLIIDPRRIDPISRLGPDQYASLGEVITIPRPQEP